MRHPSANGAQKSPPTFLPSPPWRAFSGILYRSLLGLFVFAALFFRNFHHEFFQKTEACFRPGKNLGPEK